jgi:catechol 2,3-dioxygenase-like lactoylglutathione lyase family enzyme
MTTPSAPRVECQQQHPSLAVSDVLAAADFYTKKLGFFVAFTWGDPPTMAGVNLGHVQIFLEQGTPAPKGCSVYFVIGDTDEFVAGEATAASLTALYEFQRANGVEVVQSPGDRPWGVQFHDILYRMFRDILYTSAREGRRKKPSERGEGWRGE